MFTATRKATRLVRQVELGPQFCVVHYSVSIQLLSEIHTI